MRRVPFLVIALLLTTAYTPSSVSTNDFNARKIYDSGYALLYEQNITITISGENHTYDDYIAFIYMNNTSDGFMVERQFTMKEESNDSFDYLVDPNTARMYDQTTHDPVISITGLPAHSIMFLPSIANLSIGDDINTMLNGTIISDGLETVDTFYDGWYIRNTFHNESIDLEHYVVLNKDKGFPIYNKMNLTVDNPYTASGERAYNDTIHLEGGMRFVGNGTHTNLGIRFQSTGTTTTDYNSDISSTWQNSTTYGNDTQSSNNSQRFGGTFSFGGDIPILPWQLIMTSILIITIYRRKQ